MYIPEIIKVGGFTITIKDVKDLVVERSNLGEYHSKTQEIHLDSDSTHQQKEETFLHEVFEAIKYIYDIDMSHEILSLLATVLHQVLIDNFLIKRKDDGNAIKEGQIKEGCE